MKQHVQLSKQQNKHNSKHINIEKVNHHLNVLNHVQNINTL